MAKQVTPTGGQAGWTQDVFSSSRCWQDVSERRPSLGHCRRCSQASSSSAGSTAQTPLGLTPRSPSAIPSPRNLEPLDVPLPQDCCRWSVSRSLRLSVKRRYGAGRGDKKQPWSSRGAPRVLLGATIGNKPCCLLRSWKESYLSSSAISSPKGEKCTDAEAKVDADLKRPARGRREAVTAALCSSQHVGKLRSAEILEWMILFLACFYIGCPTRSSQLQTTKTYEIPRN